MQPLRFAASRQLVLYKSGNLAPKLANIQCRRRTCDSQTAVSAASGCSQSPEGGSATRKTKQEGNIRATGSMVEGKDYYWLEQTLGYAHEQAVFAGVDYDGGDLYVCRCRHEGDLVPGKLAPKHGCAYVPWGGEEHVKLEYEVLVAVTSEGRWVPTRNGCVPIEAVEAGSTANCETLYVGRAEYDGILTPGKVQPSHGVCYISYAGLEIACPEYEVLIL